MARFGSWMSMFALIALAISAGSHAHAQGGFDRALDLVPSDAAGFICVPSLKRLNDDLYQCIERMDRPATSVLGRPLDQLKARLGISVAVNDRGSLLAWWPVADAAGVAGEVRMLVPTEDPEAFLRANFEAVPESGPNAVRGLDEQVWFARSIDGHVLLSPDAAAVADYDAAGGMSDRLRARVAGGWNELDLIVWGGPAAMRDLAKPGRMALVDGVEPPPGFDLEAAERWRKALATSLAEGLVTIDVDPLGLAIRTRADLMPDSPLAAMVADSSPGAARLDRVPEAPFYLAGSIDLAALGGAAPLRGFAKLAGLPEGMWLEVAENLKQAQLAIYPSKLGIAAGGFFNDASLAIEAEDLGALREAIETGVGKAGGDAAGMRWSGTFERDRTLKNGREVDAFEVSQSAIPAGEADAIGAVDLAQRQLVWQIVFGSRGLNGFFEPAGGEWSVVTFSQRPDVLGRAIEAAANPGPGLDRNGAIRALRQWLPEGAQMVGFLGVGQFGKLIKQISRMIPGGGDAPLPEIRENIEPVAFGVSIGPTVVESAVVIPAGVLGLGFDQVMEAAMQRLTMPSEPAPVEPAS